MMDIKFRKGIVRPKEDKWADKKVHRIPRDELTEELQQSLIDDPDVSYYPEAKVVLDFLIHPEYPDNDFAKYHYLRNIDTPIYLVYVDGVHKGSVEYNHFQNYWRARIFDEPYYIRQWHGNSIKRWDDFWDGNSTTRIGAVKRALKKEGCGSHGCNDHDDLDDWSRVEHCAPGTYRLRTMPVPPRYLNMD